MATLPARSPTAQAIGYALNHWDGLERFLHDGRIELDTNTVERAMRPVALSRKNALFAGSDEGGANWAAIASLIETCKLNGVEPQRYLTEVLTRLVNAGRRHVSTSSCPGIGTHQQPADCHRAEAGS